MDISEELAAKRQEILKIAQDHGARFVRVFGSAARGDAERDSDIDLLVKLDSDRTLLDHAALELELRELLSRKVDVVTEGGLSDRARARILGEAIPL